MVSDKIFKDFKNVKVLLQWQPVSEGIKFFPDEDYGRNISVKFNQNRISSFREEHVLRKS